MEILSEEILGAGWQSSFIGDKIVFEDITDDSRKVNNKTIFLAFDGLKSQGKDFAAAALMAGAPAVFADKKYEAEILAQLSAENHLIGRFPLFVCNEYESRAGEMISRLTGSASKKIKSIAITGTNGKTTTAWAIFQSLKNLGHRPSYVGTIGIELPEESSVAVMTTPPLVEIHRIFRRAMEQHSDFAIFETSSHGLKQGRLGAIEWKIGMFTNLTEDHRDYHVTMEDYYLSKRILFEELLNIHQKNSADKGFPCAIVNVDDPYGLKLYEWIKSKNSRFNAISLGKSGELKIKKIIPDWHGYCATLEYQNQSYFLKTRLIGTFNVYNLTMAFCAMLVFGFEAEDVLGALGLLEGAPGRMEVYRLRTGGMIVVDYAHTPDALQKALQTIYELQPKKITVIFGCGGERDQEKRPEMGRIAEDFADFVIITNDNPRSEDPLKIINQIQSGMVQKNHIVEPDRRSAIENAAAELGSGEVLLLAGKGHEDYQILPQGRIFFSDREVAADLCKKIKPEIKEI